jgi:selenocysteine lyase/cysteine desulfurase
MRRKWLPLLNKARGETAQLLGATSGECVIVPNTTHGINTIMTHIEWKDGDRIGICKLLPC